MGELRGDQLERQEWKSLSDKDRTIFTSVMKWVDLKSLEHVDPEFYRTYTEGLAGVTDEEQKWRLDLKAFDKIDQLRKEGKLMPVAEVRKIAREAISLPPDEMPKFLEDFAKRLETTKES